MKTSRAALVAALIATSASPLPTLAQHRKPPAASSAQAHQFMQALRAIDARASVGITFADYSRATGDLKIAAEDLDEELQRRHADDLRQSVAAAIEPYEQANTVWSTCVSTDACGYGLIVMSSGEPLSKFVASLLDEYPSLAKPEADGGVLVDGTRTGRVFYQRLLSGLWVEGAARAKKLRAQMH